MSVAELLLIGIGLSMDAFAVSVGKGLGMKKVATSHALLIALFFGGFQALMPLIGFLIGSRLDGYIAAWDHWIAFILLGAIGAKMLIESRRGGEADPAPSDGEAARLDINELTILAVATSIDALAVGVSFAVLNVDIAPAAGMIGCTTFAIALAGVYIGNFFGLRFKRAAELVGGAILVLIGLKILLEHLGVIAF